MARTAKLKKPRADAPLSLDADASRAPVRMWVGDCRRLLSHIPEVRDRAVRLVFADPPFNWNRAYDQWHDAMPDDEYLAFTRKWLDLCTDALAPNGSLWVNIPDDWAAEIVVHLKSRGLTMVNWCIWHYRFGQNTKSRFINSKVHALYFCKDPSQRVWNPQHILETSDRRAIYADPRTESKRDGMPPGLRVPMDVWYGTFWGRIQGNNKERRSEHDNQLPEVYLERVILACSDEGDVVLDPFIGSGTTAVVAREYNRPFVGTEFSLANAQRALERCKLGMIRRGALHAVSSAIHPRRRGAKPAKLPPT